MEAKLYYAAERLDFWRARLLRLTLAFPLSQAIFRNRALRLLLLFCAFACCSFALSFNFPLWILLLGPAVYGLPHLFSSYRYVGAHVGKGPKGNTTKAIWYFTAIFVLVSAVRIALDLRYVSSPIFYRIPNLPELLSLPLSLLGCVLWLRRRPGQVLWALGLLFPLIYFSYTHPFATLGLLLLAHNFIGFFYWIFAARNRAEFGAAALSFSIFIVFNILLFAGMFDLLEAYLPTSDTLPFAKLSVMQVGRTIFPYSLDAGLWEHGVVAYAFGQSVHYFVWLKAIPDQHHTHQVPTTFRQSLALGKLDFSPRYYCAMVIFLLLGFSFWLILSIPTARTVYFALSAYHGYLELVGLSLTPSRNLWIA